MEPLPAFIFFWFSLLSAARGSSDEEADVLLTFKRQLTPSPFLQDWDPASKHSLCNWTGITCSPRKSVVGINLSKKKLEGLSVDTGLLLNKLPSLAFLNVSSNMLHGTFPQQLTACGHLSSLDLSDNFLVGSFPLSISRCTKLETLSIARNNMTGTLHSSLSNCSRLKYLDVSSNMLAGSIPRELGLLQSMQHLDLGTNFLTGDIPSELGRLSELQVLRLGSNRLTGQVSAALGNCTKLTFLGVEDNQLLGSIPPELGQLRSLQRLDLSTNNLTGELPATLSNCSELVFLILHHNKLSGQLPSELGMLNKVQTFYFDLNQFTGRIPSSLSNCSALSRILFYYNNFTGSIPSELSLLSNLFTLELSGNRLTGELFDLGVFKNLAYVSVASNLLHGKIPPGIVNCTNLINMDFSGNHFTGGIPRGIGQLRNLTRLQLHDNELTGEIPAEIGNLTVNLQELLLQSNNLEGVIPGEIFSCKAMVVLDLSSNKLVGAIQRSVCNLSNLTSFNLSHNQLTGEVPGCNGASFPHLRKLDLSFNQLTGSIPVSIPSTVGEFVLSGNKLQGSIPEPIGTLNMVQRIDLSLNSLSGAIPTSFRTCIQLQYLDLSSNKLEGFITLGGGKLMDLRSLNLSHNKFRGPIPEDFQNLRLLTVLDLSGNHLSGPIPSFLSALPYLQYFNVSNNQMVGPVPVSGVFQNLSAASFSGNSLCGQVVHRSCKRSRGKSIALPLATVPVALLLLSLVLCWTFRHKFTEYRMHHRYQEYQPPLLEEFSMERLLEATDCYNDDNLIGFGADSSVYRGVLPDGTLVAVKKFNNTQSGMHLRNHHRAFVRELQALANIRHRNLIRIFGYCREDTSLVLEFMVNGSVNTVLPLLHWRMRFSIARDVAQGLAYLHHDCPTPVVHCDLKPSNVLLDVDFIAHLADFGISSLVHLGQETTTSSLRGTLGYIAPEYVYAVRPSTKGDVYSYGVLLLELITGKSPTGNFPDGHTLISWVASTPSDQLLDPVVLEAGLSSGDLKAIEQVKELALRCTSYRPPQRPEMRLVVNVLRAIERPAVTTPPTLEKLATL